MAGSMWFQRAKVVCSVGLFFCCLILLFHFQEIDLMGTSRIVISSTITRLSPPKERSEKDSVHQNSDLENRLAEPTEQPGRVSSNLVGTKSSEMVSSNTSMSDKPEKNAIKYDWNDSDDTERKSNETSDDARKNILDEKNSEKKMTSPINVQQRVSKRRYLLIVHYDSNGPNVQYAAWRSGVAFALHFNRTVVELMFRAHGLNQENHTLPTRHYVNDTYDIKKLQEVVDFATLDEFNRDCNHSVQTLLLNPLDDKGNHYSPESYERQKQYYNDHYHVSLPEVKHLPKTLSDRMRALENSASLECVAVHEPSFWRPPPYPKPIAEKLSNILDKQVVLIPHIRKTAQQISEKICDGKPYAAVHWRNRTGEGCAPPRGCDDRGLRLVKNMNKTGEVAAKDIRNFVEKQNLSCVYVALPRHAKVMLKIMKDAHVPNVVGKDDIAPPKFPDVEKYKRDNYFWSLVEQEICARSHVYIATVHSSWEGNVMSVRRLRNAKTVKMTDVVSWIADDIAVRR
ncbi:uncharacterized protein [Ptychodera flava]|uniref:uncharacterized protein n=1 Tax=Ptychodera flava TaxID=63121 RepID=UPI00396A8517